LAEPASLSLRFYAWRRRVYFDGTRVAKLAGYAMPRPSLISAPATEVASHALPASSLGGVPLLAHPRRSAWPREAFCDRRAAFLGFFPSQRYSCSRFEGVSALGSPHAVFQAIGLDGFIRGVGRLAPFHPQPRQPFSQRSLRGVGSASVNETRRSTAGSPAAASGYKPCVQSAPTSQPADAALGFVPVSGLRTPKWRAYTRATARVPPPASASRFACYRSG